jgi:hypothetical protein
LRLDGSRVADAALIGIDEFEQAQERRRRSAEDAEEQAMMAERPLYGPPKDRLDHPRVSWRPQVSRHEGSELPADWQDETAFSHGPVRPSPRSAHPFEDWWLAQRLPLTPDNRLNIPRFRR